MIPSAMLSAFGLSGEVTLLPGGTRPAYRAGDIVVKYVHTESLETAHTLELLPWLQEVLVALPAPPRTGVRGKLRPPSAEPSRQNASTPSEAPCFRLAQPVRARDGRWLIPDADPQGAGDASAGGWAAWRYLPGQALRPTGDIPAAIAAVSSLHAALADAPKHPLLDDNTTPFGVAHRCCWDPALRPAAVHPLIAPQVDALYARMQPLPPLRWQLTHGDLNPDNVLIAPGEPPGIIDFTPYWAPAEFALATFANWIGPRQGTAAPLAAFRDVPHFEQLLLREAVRMLLVVSELDGTGPAATWVHEPEYIAAEIVLDVVKAARKP